MGANVERKLCAVPFFYVFFHTEEMTCHWQRVELNPRMTSQQPNLWRNCDLRISPWCFPFTCCQQEPSAFFFCSGRQQRCASPWFTVHLYLIDMTMQHPWHKIKTFRCARWSIQAFLSSAAKCCEFMFAKLCLSLISWFLPSLLVISSLADHVNWLIGLTDSFRTTAGSSVLPQRLSYEFDSQCQSVFLVVSCFF